MANADDVILGKPSQEERKPRYPCRSAPDWQPRPDQNKQGFDGLEYGPNAHPHGRHSAASSAIWVGGE